MYCELVSDQGSEVNLPKPLGQPREDQFQGTPAEKLMEVAGRCCYNSFGSGRPSADFHQNLLFTQKHYSVAEHVHFTIEVRSDLVTPLLWLGIPDIAVTYDPSIFPTLRLTCNLRHVLEWPDCITAEVTRNTDVDGWKNILTWAAWEKCPNVFPKPEVRWFPDFKLVEPERDTEAFVSLFLEDSLCWSHEQVRHRGNISQRSGRFCDQTDRNVCIHPYLRDYLNEIGSLSDGPEDGPNIFTGNTIPDRDAVDRSKLGELIGQHIAQGQVLYTAIADRLQEWLKTKANVDNLTARKQARSAARYFLGQGLSTEGVWTYSIRHWRHIFKMRVNPAADKAINALMEQAYSLVKGSRYGHML